MKIVKEVWAVYEFECPECGHMQQAAEGDFQSDWIDGIRPKGQAADTAEISCEECSAEFKVVKPE